MKTRKTIHDKWKEKVGNGITLIGCHCQAHGDMKL